MSGQQRYGEHEKENSDRWLLTYADLITLLLIFFIIMYTISSTNAKKFEQVSASLRAALGNNPSSEHLDTSGANNSLIQMDLNAPPPSTVAGSLTEQQQMDMVEKKVNELIEKENLKGEVEVSKEERGLVVSITSQILFESGKAILTPESYVIIEKIGKILLAIPGNHIKVEGHTDNDPINTREFPSNWELSSARATNVLRILIDKSGLNPEMLSSSGYGEFRPKVPNTTPGNKAKNRRVNIVIVKNMYDKSEPGLIQK